MFKNIIKAIGGDPNKRDVRKYTETVDLINSLSRQFEDMSDDALRATARMGERGDPLDGRHVLDLGEAWRAYSGHPMVYAVWVAQRPFCAEEPDSLASVRQALARSRRWGAENLAAIVQEAHRRTGVPAEVLSTYYGRLTYALGKRETEGLRLFAEEAALLEGAAPRRPMRDPLEVIA